MATRQLSANEQLIITQQLQTWMPYRGSILSNVPIIYNIASPAKRALIGVSFFILIFLYTLQSGMYKQYIIYKIIFIVLWYPFQYFSQNFVNNRVINALQHLPENATYRQYYKYMYGF